jgi:hypothetical protein
VKNIDEKGVVYMLRIMMVFLSLLIIAGCGTVNTNQPDIDQPDEKKTIDLSTKLEVNQMDDIITFNVKLNNSGQEDAELLFSSGQQFEIIVKNQEGQEVYRYSEGKMFTQAIQEVKLKAGESLEWNDEWDLKKDSVLVPNGEYTVTVEVLAQSKEETIELKKENLQDSKSMLIERIITPEEEDSSNGAAGTHLTYDEIENDAFRHFKVEGTNGQYTVTGEARVFEGVFGYAVTDGHVYYIEDMKQVDEGAPSWSPFTLEISIPKEKLPVNGTVTLELYEESSKDGSKVNMLFVPLESSIN